MPLGPRTSFALHRFTLEEGLPTNISAAHLAMSAFGQKVSKLWENTDSQEAVVTEKTDGRGGAGTARYFDLLCFSKKSLLVSLHGRN